MTPAAVVRRRRRRNSELRNAEVCKDRRTAEWTQAAATAGLRSINRRKTQDAAAESGTTEATRRRRAAKNARDASGGERSPIESPYSSLLPYLSVGDYWPPNKGSSSLVKGACERARREPISIGRCQESDATARGWTTNESIDRSIAHSLDATIGPSICLTISPYRRRHAFHSRDANSRDREICSKQVTERADGRDANEREREAPVCACVRKATRPYARPRSVRSLIRFAEAEEGGSEGRGKEGRRKRSSSPSRITFAHARTRARKAPPPPPPYSWQVVNVRPNAERTEGVSD